MHDWLICVCMNVCMYVCIVGMYIISPTSCSKMKTDMRELMMLSESKESREKMEVFTDDETSIEYKWSELRFRGKLRMVMAKLSLVQEYQRRYDVRIELKISGHDDGLNRLQSTMELKGDEKLRSE
jgi:hypothetical protein